MSGRRSNRTAEDRRIDDVEELLKATEDELLLDLSVGSHISKVAPSYIDSDLNRRFQALKKPSVASSSSKPVTQSTQKPVSDGGDDLLARLAALKGSSGIGIEGLDQVGESDEEDEVEKIIQWAKDAARLDPSPPTDSDDSDNFQPSDIEEDDDDDLEEERKSSQKKKQRPPKKLVQIAKKRPGQ